MVRVCIKCYFGFGKSLNFASSSIIGSLVLNKVSKYYTLWGPVIPVRKIVSAQKFVKFRFVY